MIFNKELSEDQLQELFADSGKCLGFLAELKWGAGFICKKCGNDNSCSGRAPHSRRCTRCKTEESATAGTIFHHCRFELSKAFFIAYTVCRGTENLSSYEYARRLSLRQMTCWKFSDKLRKAIQAHGENPGNWLEILS